MNYVQQLANRQMLDLVAYEPGKPIEETARELGLAVEDIVKLASNENPLGPSPKAVEAIKAAAGEVHLYPDGAAYRLRMALAEKFDVKFEETVVGAGSSEIIELLCHAFLNPDVEVVAARHAFSMYPIMAKLFGAGYVQVPNKPDWSHDLNAFLHCITPKTRLVFVTNPTNPLGTVVSQEEIDNFMNKVPAHVIVCFDEAYYDFAVNPADTLKYVRQGRNVAVLRTFSKSYGLAGMRIGFGLMPADIAAYLHRARTPFNLPVLAQEAALAALQDEEHLRRTVENNAVGMKFYQEQFTEMGLKWIPSQGNFILVHVGDGAKVFQEMLKRGVILRAQGGYGLPEWVRISIGTPSENEKCIRVMKEVLAGM